MIVRKVTLTIAIVAAVTFAILTSPRSQWRNDLILVVISAGWFMAGMTWRQ